MLQQTARPQCKATSSSAQSHPGLLRPTQQQGCIPLAQQASLGHFTDALTQLQKRQWSICCNACVTQARFQRQLSCDTSLLSKLARSAPLLYITAGNCRALMITEAQKVSWQVFKVIRMFWQLRQVLRLRSLCAVPQAAMRSCMRSHSLRSASCLSASDSRQ